MKRLHHTICFVGSDKNAGKTTAFNFVYQKLKEKHANIVLLSIGINGEDHDSLEGHIKPKIVVKRNDYFITEQNHLNKLSGRYEIISVFTPPDFKKVFVLSKALFDFSVVLEGPNEKKEIVQIKNQLKTYFEKVIILLDGSIDRQFIASKDISDEFFFALLLSSRSEQIKKVHNVLRPLSYKVVDHKISEFLFKHIGDLTKTIIFDDDQNIIYQNSEISFLDKNILPLIGDHSAKKLFFYLNGAMTSSLFEILSPFKNLTLILDNFTQDFISFSNEFKNYSVKKMLLNPVNLKGIFIKEDTLQRPNINLPDNIPVYNLFRDEALCEIRI